MKTKYLKLFERYYNGEMEEPEKEMFQSQLQNDHEMADAYREYLSIYEALKDKETLEFRTKLNEIRDEFRHNRKKDRFMNDKTNWLLVAALFILIAGITVITSFFVLTLKEQKKYVASVEAEFFKEYVALDAELMRFDQRNVDFKLLEPASPFSIDRNKPLQLSWTANSDDPLIMELINWDGRIIYSSRGTVKSPYVIKGPLPAGIFVYRFRTSTQAYGLGFLFLL
ncbi:MAG: hypothetical protein KBC43_02665 [Bacteroidales bacterium]|nr:hypothetical protein [Bacteroidales bacterium]